VAGLRPFRTIPKDLADWSRWMRDQEVSGSVASSTTTTEADGTTTTVTTTAGTSWTIVEFSGSYTLRSGDEGKLLVSTGSGATNVTIDPGTFSIGDQIVVWQYGTGAVTIVAGSGTTIRTPTSLVINEQYGSVTLIEVYNNEWMIAGRMTP
jgi:hypothetical protein